MQACKAGRCSWLRDPSNRGLGIREQPPQFRETRAVRRLLSFLMSRELLKKFGTFANYLSMFNRSKLTNWYNNLFSLPLRLVFDRLLQLLFPITWEINLLKLYEQWNIFLPLAVRQRILKQRTSGKFRNWMVLDDIWPDVDINVQIRKHLKMLELAVKANDQTESMTCRKGSFLKQLAFPG